MKMTKLILIIAVIFLIFESAEKTSSLVEKMNRCAGMSISDIKNDLKSEISKIKISPIPFSVFNHQFNTVKKFYNTVLEVLPSKEAIKSRLHEGKNKVIQVLHNMGILSDTFFGMAISEPFESYFKILKKIYQPLLDIVV